ncbi:CID domain-containing protein [Mycena indigotica]|uniref:CID domain-containing protein n=1 Tax=Mycena indigotica TaxID=2126181 RepID=A0A8H6T2X2_9AGAR|nr:CID domain-containing protein [Mycena indigotica]KAF7309904.1 CID domain-containing protein [Mycena indigotica]
MSHLAEFEASLKEVVNAKRLSASKMNNLTDIAMKSMADDTQLVSILYRTHKSLTPSAKISSLYVFDALARAARSQVTKQGITGDINSQPGNSATFLLKLEGVLEGLFQDMISTATSEGKEKTKKVLDIWVKGSTFPSPILARLKDVTTEKDNQVKVTLDPRAAAVAVAAPLPQTPAATLAPPPPVLDPQATLLALLTQAAANNAIQTNVGQAIPSATAAAPQLALLQQLTANLNNTPPPQPAFSPHSPPHSPAQDHNFYGRRHDPRSEYQQQRSNNNNNPHDGRGNYRGGFRGRGRGEGRSWDNRDRFNKDNRDDDRRQRRSRSKSPPPRGGERRNARPYSPRRPSTLADPRPRVVQPPQAGLDEFGREIRQASPSPEPPDDIVDEKPAAAHSQPHQVTSSVKAPAPPSASNYQSQMSSVDVNASSPLPVVANDAPQPTSGQTLEDNVAANLSSFDASTFDFTSPASWEALGKMWQASFGTAPTMEQLMQYVMSGGTMTVATGQQQAQPQPQPQPQQQQQQQRPYKLTSSSNMAIGGVINNRDLEVGAEGASQEAEVAEATQVILEERGMTIPGLMLSYLAVVMMRR